MKLMPTRSRMVAVGAAVALLGGGSVTAAFAGPPPPPPHSKTVDIAPADLVQCPSGQECAPNKANQFTVVNQSGASGSVSIVAGPDTPPLGAKGSLQMAVTGGGDHWSAFNYDHTGTKLSDITALSYWTYTDTLPHAPALQLEIDPGNTGSSVDSGVTYSTLNFEPYLNSGEAALQTGTWQNWDVLSGTVWGTHLSDNPQTGGTPESWQQFLLDYPNASIIGGFGVNVGSGWSAMTGNADGLTIGTADGTTVYDFKPGPTPPPPPADLHPFHQDFQNSTDPFCPANSGNPPCDGAQNDYGTIDIVPSGFSNGGSGNYAPFTKALSGHNMAIVSGTSVQNQGRGCPSSATEYCTGPYALFGTGSKQGHLNSFGDGFTVTDDLYLSPSTAAPVGSLVDSDVELNSSSGHYGIDEIITACAQSGGFVINFGHNSPGPCSGTPVITSPGWYRFVYDFTDSGGDAVVTESVYSESGLTQVATSGPQPVNGASATPVSTWGGPGYFWLPTEDFSGLPLANFALQPGDHPTGNNP